LARDSGATETGAEIAPAKTLAGGFVPYFGARGFIAAGSKSHASKCGAKPPAGEIASPGTA